MGNDLEPMLFYGDTMPKVAAALADQLDQPDPTIRRLALQALVTLRGYRDPATARAVLVRQGDSDAGGAGVGDDDGQGVPARSLARRGAIPRLLAMIDELLDEPGPRGPGGGTGPDRPARPGSGTTATRRRRSRSPFAG